MSSWCHRRRLIGEASLVISLMSACTQAAPLVTATAKTSAQTSMPTLTATPAHVRESPSPTWTPRPLAPTATVGEPVVVTALGNVNVRRGPDLAFNPVGILLKGQASTANGRDVLSNWLRVPLGGDGSEYGWISIMSEFTRVTGNVNTLPELDPHEWPDPAWLRNCTFHELWVSPVGLALPPVSEFPNNELRLNPGTYTVADADVEGYPEILKADLREGKTIEVLVDGLGEKKKCPSP